MTTSTPPKIMIVDDSTAIRSILRSLLHSEGYEVVGEYGSGRNILTAIEKLKPNIICLDYNLPEVNGIELLGEIHAAYPAIAVVMITGSESLELETTAAEAGASGFIRKPFTQETIIKDFNQVTLAQKALSLVHRADKQQITKPQGASVVIADDSSSMRMLLAAILTEANFAVVGQACDGKQAVELVSKHRPDFVCLDIEMPVMTGLEALKEIYAIQPAIKALMITASADRDRVIQATKMGAKGYIIKPYQPSRVIDVINKLLG